MLEIMKQRFVNTIRKEMGENDFFYDEVGGNCNIALENAQNYLKDEFMTFSDENKREILKYGQTFCDRKTNPYYIVVGTPILVEGEVNSSMEGVNVKYSRYDPREATIVIDNDGGKPIVNMIRPHLIHYVDEDGKTIRRQLDPFAYHMVGSRTSGHLMGTDKNLYDWVNTLRKLISDNRDKFEEIPSI